jgi:hypothetical protein
VQWANPYSGAHLELVGEITYFALILFGRIVMAHVVKKAMFNGSLPVFSVIDFLSSRYQEINRLFGGYELAVSVTEKRKTSVLICETLLASMQFEEATLFPEIKKSLKDKGALSAIIMEHSILKYLVAEIESLDADSVIYDIKIQVLGERVKQLIKEKQHNFFPKVIATGKVDFWQLGAELSEYQAA